jgi:hypothetical protein
VTDDEHEDLLTFLFDPVDHAPIAYPESSVAFVRIAERFSVTERLDRQTLLDGFLDPRPYRFRQGGDVLFDDRGMITDPV